MKVDFNTVIRNYNNAPFVIEANDVDAEGKPIKVHVSLTLRSVCHSALLESSDDSLDEKTKCGEISLKIQEADNGIANLSSDEILFVKQYIAKYWKQPMIVTRAVRILEGLEESKG